MSGPHRSPMARRMSGVLRIAIVLGALAVLAPAIVPTPASAITLPSVDSGIYAMASDGAGGVYVGGAFTSLRRGQSDPSPVARRNLARIQPDGTVDPAFRPDPDGSVFALTVRDGVLYVGGNFSTIGGATRRAVAALNADGSARAWAPVVSHSDPSSTSVFDIEVTPSTTYLAGQIESAGSLSQPRAGLAAFDTTSGALRPLDVAAFGNGRDIVVDGGTLFFGSTNGVRAIDASTGAVLWRRAATDGASVLELDGDTLYAGGVFTAIDDESGVSRARPHIAAFSRSGVLQPFAPSLNGSVTSIKVSDNVLYIGGSFSTVLGQPRKGAAAMLRDGGMLPWDLGLNHGSPEAFLPYEPPGGGAPQMLVGGFISRLAPQWAWGMLASTATRAGLVGTRRTVDFGTVTQGAAPSTTSITFSHEQAAAFTVDSVSLTGDDVASFQIASNTCTGTIAAGGSCAVGIQMLTSTPGSRSASLAVRGSSDAAVVSLSGVVQAPPSVPATPTTPVVSPSPDTPPAASDGPAAATATPAAVEAQRTAVARRSYPRRLVSGLLAARLDCVHDGIACRAFFFNSGRVARVSADWAAGATVTITCEGRCPLPAQRRGQVIRVDRGGALSRDLWGARDGAGAPDAGRAFRKGARIVATLRDEGVTLRAVMPITASTLPLSRPVVERALRWTETCSLAGDAWGCPKGMPKA